MILGPRLGMMGETFTSNSRNAGVRYQASSMSSVVNKRITMVLNRRWNCAMILWLFDLHRLFLPRKS